MDWIDEPLRSPQGHAACDSAASRLSAGLLVSSDFDGAVHDGTGLGTRGGGGVALAHEKSGVHRVDSAKKILQGRIAEGMRRSRSLSGSVAAGGEQRSFAASQTTFQLTVL